jgi:hypothetical protein
MYAFGGIKPGRFGLDFKEISALTRSCAKRRGFKAERTFLKAGVNPLRAGLSCVIKAVEKIFNSFSAAGVSWV